MRVGKMPDPLAFLVYPWCGMAEVGTLAEAEEAGLHLSAEHLQTLAGKRYHKQT